MRTLDPEVVDAIWETIEPLIPVPSDSHPLGCHRPQIPDRLCFWRMLVRLVTGCSWVSVEAILERRVSDATLRTRRDEWIAAGVFDRLRREALAAYDRIIGLHLSEVGVDGSIHKGPAGGEGTGKSPVDRRKLGWKWSITADRGGIPLGWAIDGANRSDLKLLEPTLADVARQGLLVDIETLHLYRSYDIPKVRRQLHNLDVTDLNIQRRKPRLGLRWIVEGTNSWLSNYGQLRRNTDRANRHRHAHLCLVTAIIIIAKLIDWRNRWNPDSRP